jgi:hypothetical protein
MAHINIDFKLFSAFYSPLISLMSGGLLQVEGLEPIQADLPDTATGLHFRLT